MGKSFDQFRHLDEEEYAAEIAPLTPEQLTALHGRITRKLIAASLGTAQGTICAPLTAGMSLGPAAVGGRRVNVNFRRLKIIEARIAQINAERYHKRVRDFAIPAAVMGLSLGIAHGAESFFVEHLVNEHAVHAATVVTEMGQHHLYTELHGQEEIPAAIATAAAAVPQFAGPVGSGGHGHGNGHGGNSGKKKHGRSKRRPAGVNPALAYGELPGFSQHHQLQHQRQQPHYPQPANGNGHCQYPQPRYATVPAPLMNLPPQPRAYPNDLPQPPMGMAFNMPPQPPTGMPFDPPLQLSVGMVSNIPPYMPLHHLQGERPRGVASAALASLTTTAAEADHTSSSHHNYHSRKTLSPREDSGSGDESSDNEIARPVLPVRPRSSIITHAPDLSAQPPMTAAAIMPLRPLGPESCNPPLTPERPASAVGHESVGAVPSHLALHMFRPPPPAPQSLLSAAPTFPPKPAVAVAPMDSVPTLNDGIPEYYRSNRPMASAAAAGKVAAPHDPPVGGAGRANPSTPYKHGQVYTLPYFPPPPQSPIS